MDSKRVFDLRNEAKSLAGIPKLNKLNEALSIARRLFSVEPYDEWIQKAFAYTLIDLSKYYISNTNVSQAGICYNELLSINFQEEDTIIESQKNYLRAKIDINYSEVQKAEELSKIGNHQEALNIFIKLISENRLAELHHEAYGWIIYRYIKDKEAELTSIQVRTFLKDYMNLKNERPSMLHSMILNFGLQYSKVHSDFNLYNFFKLWNPSNLRNEDKEKQSFNDKEIPSLISRIFREFIEKEVSIDIDYLIENIQMSTWYRKPTSIQQVLDLLREQFFWKIFTANKENKHIELWDVFNKYNQLFSKFEKTKWHSEILSLAERYMQDKEEWRFLVFFKIWNPENLLDEDWEEVYKEDKKYKSLAAKCYIKAFNLEFNKNRINEALDFIDKIDSQYRKEEVIDLLRESFFWKLFNAQKENNLTELWNIFNKYNQTFSKYEKSKWHSEILSIAERYMQDAEEWRFLDFFKIWNPENLLDEDWKKITKDENTYKPLAIKCLKKAFDIVKTQSKEFNDSWLLPIYSKAIKLFPNDEWLLRENALLFIKNREYKSAIEIYKRLILELGDRSYIWKEFSTCFENDRDLKIGMLAKAIQLEKNEDFLGDIHLELAKILFDRGLIENCLVEINSYKSHREIKGWKLSELFNEISDKTKNQTTILRDNRSIYEKYIPIAELYSYQEIEWTEAVLIDKWKNDEGKERITFSDGKSIDFSIGSRRFTLLKQSSIGNVFKFKLHKQRIQDKVEAKIARIANPTITEYKVIPLIVERTDKCDWSILDNLYAIIDFINVEKKVIHAITSANKEVFFSQGTIPFQVGDFIKAKLFTKKVKNEVRIELKEVKKIDKENVIDKFQHTIAIVDGVNEEKELFHFVINQKLQGIIKFSETKLRPKEGEFIKLSTVEKFDKKQNKQRIKVLSVKTTNESSQSLKKSIVGPLKLKFKMQGVTYEYEDLNIEEANEVNADFAFILDYYVPRQLLENSNITKNCKVEATLIFTGEKWKINAIKELDGLIA